MLKHLFSYEIKKLIHDKSGIIFGMVLPLAIGLMYQFALGNLVTQVDFEPAIAAIVYQAGSKNILTDNLSQLASFTQLDNGEMIMPELDHSQPNIVFVETEEAEARELIEQEKVDAIVNVNSEKQQIEFEIEMAPTAINAMESDLIYYSLNSYQTVANNISQGIQSASNPLRFGQEIMNVMSHGQGDIVVNKGGKVINSEAIFFYAVIGYVCMYFLTLGSMAVQQHDTYFSEEGKRLNLSPIPRFKRFTVTFITFLFPGLIVIYALVAFFASQGIPLGDSVFDIFLILTLGVTAGYLTGVSISSHVKLTEGAHTALSAAVPLIFGAFSGMMSGALKNFADQYFPLINQFNPVGLVSNGLYYLTQYPTKEAFYQNIIYLSIYIFICLIIIAIGIRRDFHENI